jgi:pimeloyl-ACP methyl ester carboxylesterase
VVVGTSAGAGIAVDLAVRRPELVGWSSPMSSPGGSPGTFRPSRRWWRWPGSARWRSGADRGRPPRRYCALPTATVTVAAPGMPFPRRGGGRPGTTRGRPLVDFRNSIGSYPSATELGTVEVPVVCSYGARSPTSMAGLVRSLAAAIPTARTQRIEGAGHALAFDALATSCS